MLLLLIIFSICLFDFQRLFAQSDTTLPDLIPYRKGDKLVFIENKGKEIISPVFDKLCCSGLFKDGFIKVKINGKYGCIDKNGTEYWEE